MSRAQSPTACEAGTPKRFRESDLGLLRGIPLFNGLGPEDLYYLTEDSRLASEPSGTMLFLQGDEATSFFVVLSGSVKLHRVTPDGHESVIAIVQQGESFAEAAAFESRVYPVSASVIEDARLLIIPARPFIDKALEDRRLAIKMLSAMSHRLRQLVNQVEDLSLKSSVERLATYLTNLCGDTSGCATVRLPLDKALIARQLGMQPETLSRSLARLRKLGIEVDGEWVRIPDVEALRRTSGVSSYATR